MLRRYLQVFPLLGFLLIFFIYPVATVMLQSLVGPSGEWSVVHYERLLSSKTYVHVLLNTFIVSGWVTLFALFVAYPVAYLMATTSDRMRGMLMLAVLIPFWTSFVIRTLAWLVLFGRSGPINHLLQGAGLTDGPLTLLYNATAVVVAIGHALIPLAILTMFGTMSRIPANLTSAAATLGAHDAQAFWRVYFPLSLPGVAAAGLLVFISSIGFFITPALLGGPRETMIAQVIIENVQISLNWGFAGAVSVMLLVATAILFLIYHRLVGASALIGDGDSSGPKKVTFTTKIGAKMLAAVALISQKMMGALPGGRTNSRSSRPLLGIYVALAVVFLGVPSLFLIPVSFTEANVLRWPPQGFTLSWYQQYFTSPVWQAATVRSVLVAICTGLLTLAISIPAAMFLVRSTAGGKTILMALILAPLILPRIIIAIALFYLFAKIGLVGTDIGLVIGHTVLAIPYVVITLMAALKMYDFRLDQAAATLGANRGKVLRKIMLPILGPGIVSAFLMALVISFDELTVALFTTGGISVTIPKQMWDQAMLSVSPELTAVSTVLLLAVTCLVMLAEFLRRRSGRIAAG